MRDKKELKPAWGVTLFSGAAFFVALGAWPVGAAMAVGGIAYSVHKKKHRKENNREDHSGGDAA